LNDDRKYIVQPLGKQDRAAFYSGEKELDSYFLERASRDVRERIAAVFILSTEDNPDTVLGYYTLSSQEIDAGDLPTALTKKIGRYRRIPATLVGRLAISERLRGRRLGEFLLMDALRRCLDATEKVMSFAVVVDAKTEVVGRFYKKYGFIPLRENRLFLPMKTIDKLFHPERNS
jgi:predicted GNAT family N-acyltransferase